MTNAPAHKTLCQAASGSQKSITEMDHPPYSPALATNDFWLFPEIKSVFQGRRYQDTEDIKKNVTAVLKAFPQWEFQKHFQHWHHHWAKCIAAEGGYFESDPSQ